MSKTTYMQRVKTALSRVGVDWRDSYCSQLLGKTEQQYDEGFQPGAEFHAGVVFALLANSGTIQVKGVSSKHPLMSNARAEAEQSEKPEERYSSDLHKALMPLMSAQLKAFVTSLRAYSREELARRLLRRYPQVSLPAVFEPNRRVYARCRSSARRRARSLGLLRRRLLLRVHFQNVGLFGRG